MMGCEHVYRASVYRCHVMYCLYFLLLQCIRLNCHRIGCKSKGTAHDGEHNGLLLKKNRADLYVLAVKHCKHHIKGGANRLEVKSLQILFGTLQANR